MKNALLLFLLLACAACGTQTKPSSDALSMELATKMAVAQDAFKNQELEKGLECTTEILLHLPAEAVQSDSTVYYIQKAFSYYSSFILMKRSFSQGIEFLDQFAASPTPFLKQHALPELFGMRSHFNLMAGQADRAMQLADSFCLLPRIQDAERFMKYNEMIASTYFFFGNNQKTISLYEQVVDTYRQGGPSKNIGRTMSWLAVSYHRMGRYEDAVRQNLEAIAFYEQAPEDYSTVVAFNEQALLYQHLGIYDKALEMNQRAIGSALRNGKYSLGDAYRTRAEICRILGQRDSAFYYLHQSVAASAEIKNIRGIYGGKLELLDNYQLYPDSMAKAIALIPELCADSAQIPQSMKAKLFFYLGKTLMKVGKSREGIAEVEKAVGNYESMESLVDEQGARSCLMDYYRRTGKHRLLADAYPRYTELQDTLQNEKTTRALAAANIRFATQQKEQQNQLLTAEVALKDSRLHSYGWIGTSLLLIALGAGCWFWMRQRSLKLHLRLQEQERKMAAYRSQDQEERLRKLITSRQELNNRNEELLRQLAEIQAAHEKTCDLDRVMESLQPRLLTQVEEEQFRSSFAELYPSALNHLRTFCSKVTRADELLCMLIVLKQTNEEMARTLGISRNSVTQSRYRLRVKMNLPEGTELNEEVQKVMINE